VPVDVVTIRPSDASYPSALKEIADPPAQLFVWGDPAVLSAAPAVAVVGTRKPTDYGIRVAAHLARELAGTAVVVSGLAYGIDTVALSEALAAGGKAVAVIGSGLDRASFYPAVNYQLAEKMVAGGGAVVSEYPPGTPPLKQNFPARNRIIAGLTLGTVVVEGPLGSGALITAQYAVEFGREVWAVPGSIFVPEAVGPNLLIQEGATPVHSAADILESLGLTLQLALPSSSSSITSVEQTISELLNRQAMSVDELARELALDSHSVSSTLTLMEIKGMVKSTGAGKFARLY
jgi:DNA processing protein